MIIRIIAFSHASRIVFLVTLATCLCFPVYAMRKDVVIMNNGDHFTGEVKRLRDGLLYIETAYVSDNIGLDWNQVESIQSTASFQIVLNSGQRLAGKIEKLPREETKKEDFLIHEATGEVQVAAASVVNIDAQKPTFWRHLQGAVDLGYSFTSGNSLSTLNVNTNETYRTTRWAAKTVFDSTFDTRSGASKTNREDLQAMFARFLNRNSFVFTLSDFLHSAQQDLNLRAALGGGYGRYLKRTTSSNLSWLGGVVYTHESFDTAAQTSDQNMEAVVGLQYDVVRFKFGEFNAQVLSFPGLTDAGRLRLTTNNALTIKLTNNFHLSVAFWDNFDSKPPQTAKRNELGISSGIGWSF